MHRDKIENDELDGDIVEEIIKVSKEIIYGYLQDF